MVPGNYSRRLPLPKVEAALQGAIHDSYIRRVLFEGVFDSWANDIPNWLTCATPTPGLLPTSKNINTEGALTFLGLWKSTFGFVHEGVQIVMAMLNPKMGVDILPDGPIVCPYYWAQSIHHLNCDIVWPAEVDDVRLYTRFNFASHECSMQEDDQEDDDLDLQPCLGKAGAPLIQLDSPEYSGVIAQRMIIERLLAQGGIRLAGILNYIFAPKDDPDRQGLFIIDIDD